VCYECELLVKKVDPAAHLPTINHRLDAGVDLYTCGDVVLPPEDTIGVRTGIAVSVPEGMCGYIKERGSIVNYPPISVGAGVLDEGYTGEIILVIKNPLTCSIFLRHHTKITQVVFQPYVRITKIIKVEELPEKESDRYDSGGVHRL
jgi:dUTP pyrophosphatase